jgi:hypothetical protein
LTAADQRQCCCQRQNNVETSRATFHSALHKTATREQCKELWDDNIIKLKIENAGRAISSGSDWRQRRKKPGWSNLRLERKFSCHQKGRPSGRPFSLMELRCRAAGWPAGRSYLESVCFGRAKIEGTSTGGKFISK